MIVLILSSSLLSAQASHPFGERDINGTARYVGMAGAMTAVGADPSAVLDNPAGLGLYRRWEVALTLRGLINNDRNLSYSKEQTNFYHHQTVSSFQLPQASIVFSLQNTGERGLRFCNFMLSYNRLRSYNRTSCSTHFNAPSIAALMVNQLSDNGLDETSVSQSLFTDAASGWLSELGYQAYLVNPEYDYIATTLGQTDTVFAGWSAAFGLQDQTALRVEESGYMDEYAFHWGGNINHRIYIGLGLNIRALDYTKKVTYSEWIQADSDRGIEHNAYLRLSGAGISGSIGIIYQPLEWLRAGASFKTPVWASVRQQTRSYINTYAYPSANENIYYETPSYNERKGLTLPLKSSVAATFLFGNKGLVSLQYDYTHRKQTDDIHTLKIGSEVVVINNMFIQMGYACESRFKHTYNQPVYRLSSNDVRTDPDFRQWRTAHYASLGLGYRGNRFFVQAAYQCQIQTYRQFAFAVTDDFREYNIGVIDTQPQPFEHRMLSHRIVFTIGWHSH